MRLPDTKRLQAGLLAGAVVACLALPGAARAEDAVTTAPVNVRAGPGTAYAALAALPPGTLLEVPVREDGRADEVFSLIGPKRYELPWKQLERQGFLATARCSEATPARASSKRSPPSTRCTSACTVV